MASGENMSKLLALYDRLLALTAIVALIVSLLYLVVKIGLDRARQTQWERRLGEMVPVHPEVPPQDVKPFEQALASLDRPLQMNYAAWTRGLVVPEARVTCVDCQRPIPYDAEQCLFCGATNPAEEVTDEGFDSDGDGMPDVWEIKYGLNPQDPADADLDSDGDGFSNLMEFRHETDPRDPASKPPYEAWLFVKEIKAEPFRLLFKSSSVLPDDGIVFGVNTRDNSRTEFKRLGELVDGFKIVEYTPKTTERVLGAGTKVTEDVSVLTLQAPDGKKIDLVKNQNVSIQEYSAILLFALDGSEIPGCKKDKVFVLRGQQYKVILVDNDTQTVVVTRVSDGEEFRLKLRGEEDVTLLGGALPGPD